MEKEVACLLFERLAAEPREQIPVLVVGIYLWLNHFDHKNHTGDPGAIQALECADREGLIVLDLHMPLKELRHRDPDQFDRFWLRSDMSASGNRYVAQQIAALLRTRPELFNVSPASQPQSGRRAQTQH